MSPKGVKKKAETQEIRGLAGAPQVNRGGK